MDLIMQVLIESIRFFLLFKRDISFEISSVFVGESKIVSATGFDLTSKVSIRLLRLILNDFVCQVRASISKIFIESNHHIFVFSNSLSIDVKFTHFLFCELFFFGFIKKPKCFLYL